MRRQTQWALGGIVAGTVMLGATGTLAVFTDTETVDTAIGAGTFQLDVVRSTPGGAVVDLNTQADRQLAVQVSISGAADGVLSLSVDGVPGQCAGLPPAVVTVAVDGVDQASRTLCQLVGRPVRVGDLVPGDPAAAVIFRVDVDPAARRAAATGPWTGALRLGVAQEPGGFSDSTTIPVTVHVPPGQLPK